jgi:hypothetical protein
MKDRTCSWLSEKVGIDMEQDDGRKPWHGKDGKAVGKGEEWMRQEWKVGEVQLVRRKATTRRGPLRVSKTWLVAAHPGASNHAKKCEERRESERWKDRGRG